MPRIKCRKSVFCILFLLFFFLGTICGILLFRCLAGSASEWVKAYCQVLVQQQNHGVFWLFVTWCRPMLLAGLTGLVPWGDRVLPVLIAGRGLLMAYAAAALYACGQPVMWLVFRGLALLPLFYLVCRWAYYAFPVPVGRER